MERSLSRLKMLLLLLRCWIIAGITAEDPPTRHYRVKNSSLCLQVVTPPPYHQPVWLFNQKAIVIAKIIRSNSTDRLDYDPNDHSLCISKLSETDGGIYKFEFYNSAFIQSAETHRLIIEETVPTPVIRMSGLGSNLSAGLCNITVNCSVRDEWAWSVCDEDSCRVSQRSLSLGKVNITISTDSWSVVCRGNNHVSTSNVSESTEGMCLRTNQEHEETSQPPTGIVTVIVIAVCVSLCAFAVCVAKGLFSTQYNPHQAETSTTQIIQSQPVEALPHPVPRVSTSSSSQAEASYENVDATQPCQTSSPREELGSKQSQQVDSVYSVLQVPSVTSSRDKSDGRKSLQEASPSQYDTLNEAEHPAQIHTVYSVVQKPKALMSQHHQ